MNETQLVRLKPADASELLEGVLRSRSLHAPWVEPPRTLSEMLDYLSATEFNERFGVRTKLGALAVVININAIVRGTFQNGFLGFYALVPHEGLGLVRWGLERVLKEAFGPLGLHRLEANVQPRNRRSAELVTRFGFRREGYSPRYLHIGGAWRDHDRYALTVEDWHRR